MTCISTRLQVKHFKPQGLAAFGISANSTVTHPQDGPEKMADKARSLGAAGPAGFQDFCDT